MRMQPHDALYHRLFSDPHMVAQLLREFVPQPWIADLDLDAMERINAKFHATTGERRDGDIVWRIPLRQGGDTYLLLLLEFQSIPDRWMALRILVYTGLLWQHLVKEKRLTPDGRLPPVFPLVLYNGDPRWTIPATLAPAIGLPEDSPLWAWQPAMRYHIVDEGAYPDADLRRRDTLAALLFRLENLPDPDQFMPLVDAVIDWFRQHDGFEALKPIFAALIGRMIAQTEGAPDGTPVGADLLEGKSMFANRAAEWKQRWEQVGRQQGLQAGLQEGREKGRQEGRREGEAVVLTRLLERRFGGLPAKVTDLIASADTPTLEAWSLRLFDAATLDDILR